MESTGEDPYLNSRFAAAQIHGFQGDDMKEDGKVCGCIKHFAGYGGAEAGREYNTVQVLEHTFREYYLPTTRKLLDTAQGLGDSETANAAEIRRDITAILHTLNGAYTKLYDTLLQDVSMDVSTEIDTLEAMLRQDGLTHDFDADFKVK